MSVADALSQMRLQIVLHPRTGSSETSVTKDGRCTWDNICLVAADDSWSEKAAAAVGGMVDVIRQRLVGIRFCSRLVVGQKASSLPLQLVQYMTVTWSHRQTAMMSLVGTFWIDWSFRTRPSDTPCNSELQQSRRQETKARINCQWTNSWTQ